MWPYWFIFIFPALFALNESSNIKDIVKTGVFKKTYTEWLFVFLFYTIVIGWRHQVGGDWYQYIELLNLARYGSQYPGWWGDDPGYRFLEWITLQMDWSFYTLNFIAAIFFSFGLIVFCTNLPRPWLALTVSVPYLVIILGMGYARQGIALGFIMIAFVMLTNKSMMGFLFYAVLGAMFHKSAVLVIPIAALAASHNRFLSILIVGVVGILSYFLFLEASVEKLTTNYIDAQYQSEGALIRLLMNILPSFILMWKRKIFLKLFPTGAIWLWVSGISFLLLTGYFLSPSSTAIDRIALYVLPIQLLTFAYLPDLLEKNKQKQQHIVLMTVIFYASVQFVWLNFALTAFVWLPYQFYWFQG